jgi:hypothetical protein
MIKKREKHLSMNKQQQSDFALGFLLYGIEGDRIIEKLDADYWKENV